MTPVITAVSTRTQHTRNVKGEFESLGELLSVREIGIGNQTSPMNCVLKNYFFGRSYKN